MDLELDGAWLEQRKRTPAGIKPAGHHHVDSVSQITQVPRLLVFVLMVPNQICEFIHIPWMKMCQTSAYPGATDLNFCNRPTNPTSSCRRD
jgi:hypothetical protein